MHNSRIHRRIWLNVLRCRTDTRDNWSCIPKISTLPAFPHYCISRPFKCQSSELHSSRYMVIDDWVLICCSCIDRPFKCQSSELHSSRCMVIDDRVLICCSLIDRPFKCQSSDLRSFRCTCRWTLSYREVLLHESGIWFVPRLLWRNSASNL